MTQRHYKLNGAFSLLEMVMASALVAGALVPTMTVMRDAMTKSRELSRRNLMANYAVSVLEAQAAATMLNWSTASSTGNFAADGHAGLRFVVSRSDAVADGGLPGRLIHIQARVFDDTDGDITFDSDELSVLYRTKLARLQSYEDEE
jgi:hypothetical protein